ncbi:MAG: GAF domain-containing protein [Novosphingobium sp.]|jgi:class 3 adenylate cyclase|uniref:GAF domain-containing protein n=1 Tax=Novosphingobium sp. TaxID=1874826 RepID=UPI003018D762
MADIALSQGDLAALVELAPELAEETSLTSLLGRLLDRAVGLTASTSGTVYLYDDRRRKLYVAHAVGPAAALVLEKYGANGEGIPLVGSKAGGVYSSGESIIVNKIEQDPEHYKAVDQATARPTASMIAVPLAVAGERIGVVQLLNRTAGPYTAYEAALLEKFATLAAVAVRNARLFGDMAARIGAYGLPRDSVDAATLRALLNAPARAERLSVLFVDMRGYSRLEQTLRHPELLQSKLNEFLAMLAGAVLEQGGVVNKFLGDGLMALLRGPEHEARALRCAQQMIDRFAPMRDRWDLETNESLNFIDIGVGIATDTVTLCTVGSDQVREFTAVGRAVNLAAALVEQARDGRRLLADRMTFRSAGPLIEESRGPSRLQIKSVGASGPDYEIYEIVRIGAGASASAVAVSPPSLPLASAASRNVFVSYSHADRGSLDELHTHLRPFLKREEFDLWDDTRIAAGDLWRSQIETALARAGAAVLLVSPKFLSSEFIDRHELPPLFEAAHKRGLRIFWIPVSASAYSETEIAGFHALHDPRTPLDQLAPAERNAAWVRICRQVANALRVVVATGSHPKL